MVDLRMNQAASAATQRPPTSSAATAGTCCPLFNNLLLMNTFATPAPVISGPDVAQQCPQLPTTAPGLGILPALQSLSQQLSAIDRQRQQQQQQSLPQRPQDHSNSNNNYSTSNLPLQHLVANRPSAHSCMYLAAALAARATAGTRPSQHQTQQQQNPQTNHQATPINQPTNPVNSVTTSTTVTNNQVPLLNFNNYSSTPPYLDLSAPLPAPPIAAHLSSSPIANIQRLTNSISNPVAQNLAPTSNSSVTAALNQQQAAQNFRDAQPQATVLQQQQQPPPQQQQQQQQQLRSSPVQQLFQDFLINDQFHAILLNQLFPNQPFSLTIGSQSNHQPQQQPQQIVAQPVDQTRPQTLNQTGQAPIMMPPAQQITTQIPQQLQPQEVIFEQPQPQQQQNQQNYPPNNLVPRTETFAPTMNANLHQTNQLNGVAPQQRSSAELAPQNAQTQPTQQHQSSQTQFVSQPPPPPQQHQQPQGAISPMTLYPPNLSETLALLANPSVTNNLASSLFNYVFSLHLQNGGFRAEPHDSYRHASHHFHHHLHNSHHHHHHPNGQANGQDGTMPLDSMAISESKPRGLNRAEIDSLTPYIHTNEKDSRTCVICLSKFELKSKIRPLPCNHAFHAKCVDKWLRANRSCPICRRDALKTYNAKLKRI